MSSTLSTLISSQYISTVKQAIENADQINIYHCRDTDLSEVNKAFSLLDIVNEEYSIVSKYYNAFAKKYDQQTIPLHGDMIVDRIIKELPDIDISDLADYINGDLSFVELSARMGQNKVSTSEMLKKVTEVIKAGLATLK